MRRLPAISVLLLACAAAPALAASPPHYKVTLLQPLVDGQLVNVGSVNASGQSVGSTRDADGIDRAAIWNSDGTVATLSAGAGNAWSINDAGTIAGNTTIGANTYATLWSGGSMQQLPSSNGEIFTAISQSGDAAGFNNIAGGNGTVQHAIYYSGGTMNDVGALNDGSALALGINDNDQIVGFSSIGSERHSPQHAFLYSDGVMTDLGTFGGTHSAAYGINNAGMVVGYSMLADGTIHGFSYLDGTMTDIGALGLGDNADANAVNDLGQIVGDDTSALDSSQRAVLWQGGQIYDLNTLLDASGAGWQLQYASSISSNGKIVGIGTYNGAVASFLLEAEPAPAPEPMSWALMLAGFGAIGGALRARRRQAVAI